MKKIKKNTVYTFIDSQNLNLGIRSLGWNLDFKRFRQYLKENFQQEEKDEFIKFSKQREREIRNKKTALS